MTVSAIQDPALVRSQYGGYVVLTPDNGEAPLRVPYAGFNGDYQSIQAVTPTANDFPWLSRLTECTRFVGIDCTAGGQYDEAEDGATFDLSDEFLETPYFLVHLEHQVRELRLEVHQSANGGDRPQLGPDLHRGLRAAERDRELVLRVRVRRRSAEGPKRSSA